MYLLSSEEVYSDWNYSYDSAKGTSRQLDYYNNLEVSTSNYSGAIKYLNGTEYRWWLRGANGGSTYAFFDVQANGNYGTTNAPIYDYAGFSPTFRLAM